MRSIALIDYGSGNLRSAAKATERAARDAGLNAQILVTDRVEDVAQADRVVLRAGRLQEVSLPDFREMDAVVGAP